MQNVMEPIWYVSEYRLPWASRLFVLYVLITIAVSAVKVARLTERMWRFSTSKGRTHAEHSNRMSKEEFLAHSALKNKLPREKAEGEWNVDDVPALLQEVETRFVFLWSRCLATVVSLKRLSVLTFLLSALVTLWLTSRFLSLMAIQKMAGIVFLGASISEAILPFQLGIICCAVLYAIYALYHAALLRRMASWHYFKGQRWLASGTAPKVSV